MSNNLHNINDTAQPLNTDSSSREVSNLNNQDLAMSSMNSLLLTQTESDNSNQIQNTHAYYRSCIPQAQTPKSANSFQKPCNMPKGYFDNSYQKSVCGPSNSQSHPQSYLSPIEIEILRSKVPIEINQTEEICVLGQRGIWANKHEVLGWRGPVPVNEYPINEDMTPRLITKKPEQNLMYIQELAVRYLKPPTPPPPGEIIITQKSNAMTPPAPPLIIRQQPPRPITPEPLILREAPPQPPAPIGKKVITIFGKKLPPPPRKVVIERLPPIPSKPQSVIIERWLPYNNLKRRVIYKKPQEAEPVICKPKNVIIQWEPPEVVVKKDLKYLGIIKANPAEYVQRYGSTLKQAHELPNFVLEIKPPHGIVLAADEQMKEPELEGEVGALRLIDLDKEGLSQYRAQLEKLELEKGNLNASPYKIDKQQQQQQCNLFRNSCSKSSLRSSIESPFKPVLTEYSTTDHFSGQYRNSPILSKIFNEIDKELNGVLAIWEAENLFFKLNGCLGRSTTKEETIEFLKSLEKINNEERSINLNDFRKAFENLVQ
jgi:hypothetical protein